MLNFIKKLLEFSRNFCYRLNILRHLSKKQYCLFVFVFIIVLLAVPTHFSHASVWSKIFGSVLTSMAALPAIIFTFVLSILIWLAAGLLGLSTLVLSWAANNPFPVSFTIPGAYPNNQIIEIGWTLTRDFVNMFFIVGLAYIGLATALNISNFETKKVFKNLLLVALLINFTPVICGVIVDATNIISNFFLQGIDFGSIVDIFKANQKSILEMLTKPTAIADNFNVVIEALLLAVFGFVGFFLFLIYSALFILRAPIIWLLVILSPFAFFAWIFEPTKKYFKQWWDAFIQWSTIVIPAGFFLYLAMHTLVISKTLISPMENAGFIEKLFTNIAPLFVVLIFLAIGFIMSMKINAAGSGAVISASKKWGVKGLKGAGDLSKKGAKGIRNKYKGRENAPPSTSDKGAYKEWSSRHKVSAAVRKGGRFAFGGETEEEKKEWGENRGKKWARRVVRGAGIGTVATVGISKRLRKKGAAMLDEDTSKTIAGKTEKLKGKNLATVQASFDNAVTNSGRIAAVKASQDNGFFDHMNISDEMKEKTIRATLKSSPGEFYKVKNLDPSITAKVVEEEKMPQQVLRTAGVFIKDEDKEKYGKTVNEDHEKIQAMEEPQRAKILIKDENGEATLDAAGKKQYTVSKYEDTDILEAKIIAGIKAAQMNTIDEKTALKIADSEVAHEFWEGAQVSKAAELFGASFINKFQDKINDLGEASYEKNKPLRNFLKSTGGQRIGLGFGSASEIKASTEMNNLTTELKALKDELATAKDPSNSNQVRDTMRLDPLIKAKEEEIETQKEKESEEKKQENQANKPSNAQTNNTTNNTKPSKKKKKQGRQKKDDIGNV